MVPVRKFLNTSGRAHVCRPLATMAAHPVVVKADSAGLLFQARFSYMYFYEDNFIFISSGDHLDLDSMCFP